MKRMGLSFILLAAVCMLSGCGSSKVELTEEQNNVVAEYIAGALLRYDMRYEEELIYSSDAEAIVPEGTEEPVPEDTAEPPVTSQRQEQTGEVQDPELVYSSLNEVMGLDGVELNYKSSSFYDSYPKEKSDFFVIEPSVSNQLLVIEFQLSNTSSEQKKVDLSEAGIKYMLKISEKEYKPLLTALPDDLRYLSTKLEAGKKKTVTVVFEVEKDASLNSAELTITRDSLTAQIKPL